MVLAKHELIQCLRNEVNLVLHLASKIDPAKSDYRPTPGQRSTLELLRYLAIVGPIHLRAAMADAFDPDVWRNLWQNGEAHTKQMGIQEAKDAIAQHRELFTELLETRPDSDFRDELEMFGHTASRGSWLVNLVLCHYTAYRMQLFLYLKSSGRAELNTLNLWVGVDSMKVQG